MPNNHKSDPYIKNIEIFEWEKRKMSNQNQEIQIQIIEAEIRIEALQLTRKIVAALMPSPNLALILFSEQWFTVYGLIFNIDSVQSANSPVSNCSKKFNNLTGFYLKLNDPGLTCIFASPHNLVESAVGWLVDIGK